MTMDEQLREAAQWWIGKLSVELNEKDTRHFVEAFMAVLQEEKPIYVGVRLFWPSASLLEIGRRAWLPITAWPWKAFATAIDWNRETVKCGYWPMRPPESRQRVYLNPFPFTRRACGVKPIQFKLPGR
jgi:hypothetical protein